MIHHGCTIDEHIISFESILNRFIIICSFNTKNMLFRKINIVELKCLR